MSTLRSPVDQYGFHRPEDFDYENYEHIMSGYLMVLARRASRWSKIMHGTSKVRKSRRVKRFVRKGVPSELRGQVWMDISGAGKNKKHNPGKYQEALQGHSKLNERTLHSITTDIDRTFPENVYFGNSAEDKRQSLKNVLLAFAVHNPRIGYCQGKNNTGTSFHITQGLNYITGLLLLIMKDEESVFWLLDAMVCNILPDYYAEDMYALQVEHGVLSELVKNKLPEVHAHLENVGLSYSLFSTQWFICLYVDILPVETVLRIWDCLFYEGSKILLRVAVTLMMLHKDQLLAARDFTALFATIKGISKGPSAMDCHQFMQRCFELPGSMPRRWIRDLSKSVSATLDEEVEKRNRERQSKKSEKAG